MIKYRMFKQPQQILKGGKKDVEEPDNEEPDEGDEDEEDEDDDDENDEDDEDDEDAEGDEDDGIETGDELEEEVESVADDGEHQVISKKNKCSQKNFEEQEDGNDINLKELEEEEIIYGNTELKINYEKDSRISKPFLTKYEKSRCLGIRTSQLMQGAKPMVKNVHGLTATQIAYLELKEKVLPIIFHRPIPNALDEEWAVSELEYNFDSDDEKNI